MSGGVSLPERPESITASWLTQVLRGAGLLTGGTVVDCGIEITGEDRGFTGVIARVSIEYADGGRGPASLIAKFPLAERAGSRGFREYVASDPERARRYAEGCAREVHFYALAEGLALPIPRCYFGHADVDGGEVVLLLEDLADGAPGDALAGCSVEEARSVLAGMAGVHLRWWGDAGIRGLNWPGDWARTIPDRAARYRRNSALVVERYRDRLSPEIAGMISGLADHLESILAGLASAPVTLAHGDLHLDNVIFLPSPGGPAAAIIDWQAVTRGPAMLDIGGFIAESLTVEDRRRDELALLREYHERLGPEIRDHYGFDRLWQDYQRAMTVRFAGVVGWLARVEVDALEGRERALVEAIFEPGNLLTAALDHQIARDPAAG